MIFWFYYDRWIITNPSDIWFSIRIICQTKIFGSHYFKCNLLDKSIIII